MPPFKRYLGDSVYVELVDHGVRLTTENGCGPTNTIYMEPEVIAALGKFWFECVDSICNVNEEKSDGQ